MKPTTSAGQPESAPQAAAPAATIGNFTNLHTAANEGQTDVVRLLLRCGAPVNAQDHVYGNTALHQAAWKGFSQTVQVLCRYRANTSIKNKALFTPLHLACQQGHNQTTRLLLMANARTEAKNSYGDSALHTAARYGHAGVARILISAKSNVNQMNKNHDTPLHIAAAMGRRKLTKIFMQAGCDPAIKNKQNETAMDIALRKDLIEIQELIANPPPRGQSQKHSHSRLNRSNSKLASSTNVAQDANNSDDQQQPPEHRHNDFDQSDNDNDDNDNDNDAHNHHRHHRRKRHHHHHGNNHHRQHHHRHHHPTTTTTTAAPTADHQTNVYISSKSIRHQRRHLQRLKIAQQQQQTETGTLEPAPSTSDNVINRQHQSDAVTQGTNYGYATTANTTTNTIIGQQQQQQQQRLRRPHANHHYNHHQGSSSGSCSSSKSARLRLSRLRLQSSSSAALRHNNSNSNKQRSLLLHNRPNSATLQLAGACGTGTGSVTGPLAGTSGKMVSAQLGGTTGAARLQSYSSSQLVLNQQQQQQLQLLQHHVKQHSISQSRIGGGSSSRLAKGGNQLINYSVNNVNCAVLHIDDNDYTAVVAKQRTTTAALNNNSNNSNNTSNNNSNNNGETATTTTTSTNNMIDLIDIDLLDGRQQQQQQATKIANGDNSVKQQHDLLLCQQSQGAQFEACAPDARDHPSKWRLIMESSAAIGHSLARFDASATTTTTGPKSSPLVPLSSMTDDSGCVKSTSQLSPKYANTGSSRLLLSSHTVQSCLEGAHVTTGNNDIAQQQPQQQRQRQPQQQHQRQPQDNKAQRKQQNSANRCGPEPTKKTLRRHSPLSQLSGVHRLTPLRPLLANYSTSNTTAFNSLKRQQGAGQSSKKRRAGRQSLFAVMKLPVTLGLMASGGQKTNNKKQQQQQQDNNSDDDDQFEDIDIVEEDDNCHNNATETNNNNKTTIAQLLSQPETAGDNNDMSKAVGSQQMGGRRAERQLRQSDSSNQYQVIGANGRPLRQTRPLAPLSEAHQLYAVPNKCHAIKRRQQQDEAAAAAALVAPSTGHAANDDSSGSSSAALTSASNPDLSNESAQQAQQLTVRPMTMDEQQQQQSDQNLAKHCADQQPQQQPATSAAVIGVRRHTQLTGCSSQSTMADKELDTTFDTQQQQLAKQCCTDCHKEMGPATSGPSGADGALDASAMLADNCCAPAGGAPVNSRQQQQQQLCICSPYGRNSGQPDLNEFPRPKFDMSASSAPLKEGEKYYMDLAGNVRKGPVGVRQVAPVECVCASDSQPAPTATTLQQQQDPSGVGQQRLFGDPDDDADEGAARQKPQPDNEDQLSADASNDLKTLLAIERGKQSSTAAATGDRGAQQPLNNVNHGSNGAHSATNTQYSTGSRQSRQRQQLIEAPYQYGSLSYYAFSPVVQASSDLIDRPEQVAGPSDSAPAPPLPAKHQQASNDSEPATGKPPGQQRDNDKPAAGGPPRNDKKSKEAPPTKKSWLMSKLTLSSKNQLKLAGKALAASQKNGPQSGEPDKGAASSDKAAGKSSGAAPDDKLAASADNLHGPERRPEIIRLGGAPEAEPVPVNGSAGQLASGRHLYSAASQSVVAQQKSLAAAAAAKVHQLKLHNGRPGLQSRASLEMASAGAAAATDGTPLPGDTKTAKSEQSVQQQQQQVNRAAYALNIQVLDPLGGVGLHAKTDGSKSANSVGMSDSSPSNNGADSDNSIHSGSNQSNGTTTNTSQATSTSNPSPLGVLNRLLLNTHTSVVAVTAGCGPKKSGLPVVSRPVGKPAADLAVAAQQQQQQQQQQTTTNMGSDGQSEAPSSSSVSPSSSSQTTTTTGGTTTHPSGDLTSAGASPASLSPLAQPTTTHGNKAAAAARAPLLTSASAIQDLQRVDRIVSDHIMKRTTSAHATGLHQPRPEAEAGAKSLTLSDVDCAGSAQLGNCTRSRRPIFVNGGHSMTGSGPTDMDIVVGDATNRAAHPSYEPTRTGKPDQQQQLTVEPPPPRRCVSSANERHTMTASGQQQQAQYNPYMTNVMMMAPQYPASGAGAAVVPLCEYHANSRAAIQNSTSGPLANNYFVRADDAAHHVHTMSAASSHHHQQQMDAAAASYEYYLSTTAPQRPVYLSHGYDNAYQSLLEQQQGAANQSHLSESLLCLPAAATGSSSLLQQQDKHLSQHLSAQQRRQLPPRPKSSLDGAMLHQYQSTPHYLVDSNGYSAGGAAAPPLHTANGYASAAAPASLVSLYQQAGGYPLAPMYHSSFYLYDGAQQDISAGSGGGLTVMSASGAPSGYRSVSVAPPYQQQQQPATGNGKQSSLSVVSPGTLSSQYYQQKQHQHRVYVSAAGPPTTEPPTSANQEPQNGASEGPNHKSILSSHNGHTGSKVTVSTGPAAANKQAADTAQLVVKHKLTTLAAI